MTLEELREAVREVQLNHSHKSIVRICHELMNERIKELEAQVKFLQHYCRESGKAIESMCSSAAEKTEVIGNTLKGEPI